MKKVIVISGAGILLTAVIIAFFVWNAAGRAPEIERDRISEIPGLYSMPTAVQGTLQDFTYESSTFDSRNERVTKHAMIYLPPGYNEEKTQRYNIMYLLHGYGGKYTSFLGTPDAPGKLKNILDNMIDDEIIPPTIVVAATFNDADNKTVSDEVFNAFPQEINKALLPAVESTYRTYAESTSQKGLESSRDHRVFAGFSMGGCFAWAMLKDYTANFKYYMPMSCPLYYRGKSKTDYTKEMAAEIDKGVAASGYDKNQYFVFSASGTKDYTSNQVEYQVEHLKSYSGEFTYTTTDFDDGNLMFHSFQGHYHRFSQSYAYIYNGLIKFFR